MNTVDQAIRVCDAHARPDGHIACGSLPSEGRVYDIHTDRNIHEALHDSKFAVCCNGSQVQTAATWYSQGFNSALQASMHQPMPSLVPVALRVGQVPSAILACGTYSAALVSEHGHLLDKLTLPVRYLSVCPHSQRQWAAGQPHLNVARPSCDGIRLS